MSDACISNSPCIRLIKRNKAQSVIIVSFTEVPATLARAIRAPRIVRLSAKDYMSTPSPASPYDLGVAWQASAQIADDDTADDARILARLSNVDCRRLCVVMPETRRRALETLGLRYIGSETLGGRGDLACFEFNIADYKRVPDWLNNKHWANPHRWDKFRW